MRYRKFGNTEFKVSALGFGCMRFPTTGKYEDIDEKAAIAMVRHAIDNGVNYLDTAYGYHGGNSESLVGKAIKDGYREKVKIATKLPCWEVHQHADFDRLLNEQLARLEVDHIDFYLLHALGKESWAKVRDLGVIEWAEGAQADGRIGFLGFSFHDDYDAFISIVDAYDKWTFCQIQYNYMDVENQAGTRGLKYAAQKGLAVIIMEGLLGGYLIEPPPQIDELWKTAERKRSTADWALQWLWDQPEVTMVLSGMSSMVQVDQNLVSAAAAQIGSFTHQERELIAKVRDRYVTLRPVPCTSCQYCMPCPHGVNIPQNFEFYNNLAVYNERKETEEGYQEELEEGARASACTQCRECEEKCPQKIIISEWMPFVHEALGNGKDPVYKLSPT